MHPTTSLSPAAFHPMPAMADWLRGLFSATRRVPRAPKAEQRAVAAHGMWTVQAADGQRIDCRSGCVWVTQDGDPRDVILAAGQTFHADRRGRLIVWGLEPSSVSVGG